MVLSFGAMGTVAFTLKPMNQSTELHWIDYLIILIYFGFVLQGSLGLRMDFSYRVPVSTGPQARLTQQYSPSV